MTAAEVIDRYFLEHRAKVLDVAAFLDRVDRAAGDGSDYRMDALRRCVAVLAETDPGRAERVLSILSDQSSEPVDAAGEKGASGASREGNGD